jgi:hypothetical protein
MAEIMWIQGGGMRRTVQGERTTDYSTESRAKEKGVGAGKDEHGKEMRGTPYTWGSVGGLRCYSDRMA